MTSAAELLSAVTAAVVDPSAWTGGPVPDADDLTVEVFFPTEPVDGLRRVTFCHDDDSGHTLVAYTLHENTQIHEIDAEQASEVERLRELIFSLRTGNCAQESR
jgi:hypothetical protein